MPGPKKLSTRREQFVERAQNKQEQARVDEARALNRVPFLVGRLISVKFATGGTYVTVTHRLGVPAACMVARQNYDAGGAANGPAFAENPSQSGLDINNQLSLVSDKTCTVDLWFYPRASVTILSGATQAP